MYPSSFEYHRAGSVQEAISLLDQFGDEAKLVAGGHSLIPVMKLRFAAPAHLIDITRVPGLAGVSESGATVRIGAATRHADVIANAIVRSKAPLLAETASHVGDPLIRNMGTIGGSAAHADPGADLPAALLALGATMVVTGKGGERSISADDFFTDVFTTALQPNEVLTRIEVSAAGNGTGSAYEKNPDPASGYALVGIAASVTVSGGTITDARVAMTGLGPKVMRLTNVEGALVGKAASSATADVATASASNGLVFVDDSKGSAAYKANLAQVFARRAVSRAIAKALGN